MCRLQIPPLQCGIISLIDSLRYLIVGFTTHALNFFCPQGQLPVHQQEPPSFSANSKVILPTIDMCALQLIMNQMLMTLLFLDVLNTTQLGKIL